jgi:hypothetical protein
MNPKADLDSKMLLALNKQIQETCHHLYVAYDDQKSYLAYRGVGIDFWSWSGEESETESRSAQDY